MRSIPSKTQILVVGGGPSGSYAAAALSREGFQVTLFDMDKFPRYHIGESLLPSVKPFLRFIDAIDKVTAHGFCPKPGAAIKFNQHKREGYTDFIALNPENGSWNVVRSQFDDILLKHAASCGAAVFQQVKVISIQFEDNNPTLRPVAAQYECKASSPTAEAETGTIRFDYLVDASGRMGIMSQKYLKNRQFNKSLNNIAVWGYWTGCQRYCPGTSRENAIWIEALQDETGWAWFIPLHDDTVSVGVVQDQASSGAKKRAHRERTGASPSLKSHYLDELKLAPGVLKYIGSEATLVDVGKDGGSGVKQASDFSYSAGSYAGPRFRLVGDAAAFIDPFFSSGVHLAFTGGLSAAATIASSIRGDASEEECGKWHDTKVGTAYTRFLLVVLGAYKQMRAQQMDVLSDINEDNFDRAFDLIRPVIQGTADVGKTLTDDEVQQTMDFVKNIFAPTDPEMHAAVRARVDPKFFETGSESKVLLEADLNKLVDPADEDARHVLAEVNARKPIHVMYDSQKDFGSEPINGWTVKLQRGSLGMVLINAVA